jgi:Polysaccharide biosynthesis protein
MAVFVSPSLTVVIPTQAVAQGLGAIAVLAVVYRLEGPFSLRAIDWGEARKLLGYGGWMFATNVATPALASADQFVIVSAMGVGAVAHYSVPMNLVLRSGAIPVAFGRTFFPRMSSLSGDAAYVLAVRGLSSMAYGFAAVCAPAIILSPAFFRYWIGTDFAAVSAPVAQFLFPGMWMAGLSFVGFTLLQSQGRRCDRQTPPHRISAVSGHSLGPDTGFRDCWRSHRLELPVHDRRVSNILGFRNRKEGYSSFGAPGDTVGRHFGRSSFPWFQLEHTRGFSCRDVGWDGIGRS